MCSFFFFAENSFGDCTFTINAFASCHRSVDNWNLACSFILLIPALIKRRSYKNLLMFFIDYRRNIFKADVGLVKKGQFPMAYVENAQRY